MGVKALLHLQQVQVSNVVVAQILVVHRHRLHCAQAKAAQEILEALEVQEASLTIAGEELLDVVLLLLL